MPPQPPAPRSPLALAAAITWAAMPGPRLDPATARLLADGLGGLVLFERNILDADALAGLITDLRAVAAGPLLIALDQEGGHVVRVGHPLTRFPSALALGATGSAELAFEVALASARELRALGVDVVLAPVLDLAAEPSNPVVGARSLGDDPSLVATLGAAMIRGYMAGGVIPVPKHFPGHGRTALDSHLSSPVILGGRPALEAADLPPFAAAVAAGSPALMVGHVAYAGLGRGRPASLERAVYRLARHGLGFRGAIVTDALVMDAITSRGTVPDAAVEAVAAGADVVMALEPAAAAIEALADAVSSGRLSKVRADQAYRRASRLAGSVPSIAAGALDAETLARHHALAREVARRSLTLVDDPRVLLPLAGDATIHLVECGSGRVSPIEDGTANRTRLADTIAARFPNLHADWVPANDVEGACAAVEAARHADLVVLATRDAFALEGPSRSIAASLAETGRPLVHVALRSPADLADSPGDARIAAYADVPATLGALAEALLAGREAFPGRLPMSIDADPDRAVA